MVQGIREAVGRRTECGVDVGFRREPNLDVLCKEDNTIAAIIIYTHPRSTLLGGDLG